VSEVDELYLWDRPSVTQRPRHAPRARGARPSAPHAPNCRNPPGRIRLAAFPGLRSRLAPLRRELRPGLCSRDPSGLPRAQMSSVAGRRVARCRPKARRVERDTSPGSAVPEAKRGDGDAPGPPPATPRALKVRDRNPRPREPNCRDPSGRPSFNRLTRAYALPSHARGGLRPGLSSHDPPGLPRGGTVGQTAF
jgi:hypothetical protein